MKLADRIRAATPAPDGKDGDQPEAQSYQSGSMANPSRTGRLSTTTAEQRNTQKLIYSLLDTIASHRDGNVFQDRVKKVSVNDHHLDTFTEYRAVADDQ